MKKQEAKHKPGRGSKRTTIIAGLIGVVVLGMMIEPLVTYVKDINRKKATILLFTETYQIKYLCHSLGGADAARADIAISRFRDSYPKIIDLVEESPYLPISKNDFEKFLNDQLSHPLHVNNYPNNDAHNTCILATQELDFMSNIAGTEDGKKLSHKWVSLLSP